MDSKSSRTGYGIVKVVFIPGKPTGLFLLSQHNFLKAELGLGTFVLFSMDLLSGGSGTGVKQN